MVRLLGNFSAVIEPIQAVEADSAVSFYLPKRTSDRPALESARSSPLGQSRRFDGHPLPSGLPSTPDVRPVGLHGQQRGNSRLARRRRVPLFDTSWTLENYSGNPAFRRPSVISFAFDCPPRAIHEDIVNAGSVSSRRAAASRASTSRPRCAKADARQR